MTLRIDPARLTATLDEINSFGAREGGGVERLAWSEPEMAARSWLVDRASELGLEVEQDEAGNVWAFAGRRPAVMLGSHLDTVPNAGRFDGALGIAAALETVIAARATGAPGSDALGVLCFVDEEGVRFGLGMTGSRAVAGDLSVDDLRAATTTDGTSLAEVLLAAGLEPERVPEAARRRDQMSAYLELHVEQGRRLERADAAVGVVTGIVGLSHWRIETRGETNHAGTTLPQDRRDALVPIAVAVLEAQRAMRARDDVVATVGEADVVGGATNVVPGRARATLDVRSLREATIDATCEQIFAAARHAAADNGCELDALETKRLHPAPMNETVLEACRGAAEELEIQAPEIPSMAGHDAMTLTRAGVPCGMIFVRSRGGISHSPREFSTPEDCAAGAELLAGAALRLAQRG